MMLQEILSKIKLLVPQKESSFKKVDLSLLENTVDVDIEKLRNIFKFITSPNTCSPDEKEALRKVEAIKKQYSSSFEKVIIKDFGAGHKNSLRTEESMGTEEALQSGVDREVVISEVHKSAATREKWGKLMFKIVREFKFGYCLELGTNLGISAAYQISALKLNNKGRLETIEGAEVYARLAEKNLNTIGYSNFAVHIGRFCDVLPKILSLSQPIDFVFIDGHHDENATRKYLEMIYPFLAIKSVIIFDDISWSDGMKNAWQSIYNDARIKASVDIGKWGICLIDKTTVPNSLQYFKLPVE